VVYVNFKKEFLKVKKFYGVHGGGLFIKFKKKKKNLDTLTNS